MHKVSDSITLRQGSGPSSRVPLTCGRMCMAEEDEETAPGDSEATRALVRRDIENGVMMSGIEERDRYLSRTERSGPIKARKSWRSGGCLRGKRPGREVWRERCRRPSPLAVGLKPSSLGPICILGELSRPLERRRFCFAGFEAAAESPAAAAAAASESETRSRRAETRRVRGGEAPAHDFRGRSRFPLVKSPPSGR